MSDSGSEVDEDDYVTMDTLSKEDLTAIVANPRYKTLLTELLSDSDLSANPEDRLSDGNTSDLDTSSGANSASRDKLPATPNRVTGMSDDEPSYQLPPNRVTGMSDDEPSYQLPLNG